MEFDLENPLPNLYDHLAADNDVPALFLVESDHIPSKNYFLNLKASDFDVSVRREITSLISQVKDIYRTVTVLAYDLSISFCHFLYQWDYRSKIMFAQFCSKLDPLLSYLAINYLDRFLSNHGELQLKPWVIRLIAISCTSLATKMKKTEFSLTDVQGDGGIIFDTETIRKMEFLILGALEWRMRSITPFSFISFFVSFFNLKDPSSTQVLKDRAAEIILKSQRDIEILQFKPSVIAASALLSASREFLPFQFPCFMEAISSCPYISREIMLHCYNVMQEILVNRNEPMYDVISCSETPTNVLDHHMFSSGSEVTNGITIATNTTITQRQEKNIKKRKINGCGNNYPVESAQIE